MLRTLRLPGYPFPIHVRTGSSDAEVVRQVFARQGYACASCQPDVEFILDCGANIGCTTFYLLNRYPTAKAVVVEPDPGNMSLCRKNLQPFGDRVRFVEAGVWNPAGPMKVERGGFRDGREWSFQIRPSHPGETADFDAKTIPELLRDGGFPRVDLLKMDVEAAEVSVFRNNTSEWLSRVRTLVIELHGPECERTVNNALASFDFESEKSGELTVYRNIRPRAPSARRQTT